MGVWFHAKALAEYKDKQARTGVKRPSPGEARALWRLRLVRPHKRRTTGRGQSVPAGRAPERALCEDAGMACGVEKLIAAHDGHTFHDGSDDAGGAKACPSLAEDGSCPDHGGLAGDDDVRTRDGCRVSRIAKAISSADGHDDGSLRDDGATRETSFQEAKGGVELAVCGFTFRDQEKEKEKKKKKADADAPEV